MNCEIPYVQARFRKDRGTRDQIAIIHWIFEKAREFQKDTYFCFIDHAKAFDCVDHNQLWKIYRDWNTRPFYLPSEKSMQVKKQQLELNMEQQTASKSGKEYVKVVYCHPAYLNYMLSTLCEMPNWMKHKLESRILGEISIASICRRHHPHSRS